MKAVTNSKWYVKLLTVSSSHSGMTSADSYETLQLLNVSWQSFWWGKKERLRGTGVEEREAGT